jgi:hypothetical protein
MSESLWRSHLESYLAVREAMGHSVRAERKLLGEFLDFADQKGGAGFCRARTPSKPGIGTDSSTVQPLRSNPSS